MTTYTLTPSTVQTLRLAAAELGFRLTTTYSGRGMFGATCIGVVVDDPTDLADLIGALMCAGEDDLAAGLMDQPRATDNMGRGTIVYWPGVRAAQDDEEEPEGLEAEPAPDPDWLPERSDEELYARQMEEGKF